MFAGSPLLDLSGRTRMWPCLTRARRHCPRSGRGVVTGPHAYGKGDLGLGIYPWDSRRPNTPHLQRWPWPEAAPANIDDKGAPTDGALARTLPNPGAASATLKLSIGS